MQKKNNRNKPFLLKLTIWVMFILLVFARYKETVEQQGAGKMWGWYKIQRLTQCGGYTKSNDWHKDENILQN